MITPGGGATPGGATPGGDDPRSMLREYEGLITKLKTTLSPV
jgi:hypothetical protein